MKIDHLAIWVKNLEQIRYFYTSYFNMVSSEKYVNPKKKFSSYFLSFKGTETRVEIMQKPDILDHPYEKGITNGITHFAISVGNRQKVDELTEKLRNDGFTIKGEPRVTGDGFYESVVLDPEGNLVEITE